MQCPVTTQKAWRHWEVRVNGFIGLPFLTLVGLLILSTLPGSRGLLYPLVGSRPSCPIHGQWLATLPPVALTFLRGPRLQTPPWGVPGLPIVHGRARTVVSLSSPCDPFLSTNSIPITNPANPPECTPPFHFRQCWGMDPTPEHMIPSYPSI